ncbi:MAG: ribulose-phosphate 3-epimerase [Saccharofermentanales bacterium]
MVLKYSEYKLKAKNEAIICPSILSADFARLGQDIRIVAGDADWIHIDVMDGVFVPNISLGVPVIKAIKKSTELPLDVHLMIIDPGRYVDVFADAGADQIVVHAEACTHLHRVISSIHSRGISAGVALNPATPISAVEEILPYVDLVLLMTVNPGFGGQSYIKTMTSKIARLRSYMDEHGIDAHLQVDGGIGTQNINEVFQAGANAIVVGNSVFATSDPAEAIRELRKCLD